MSCDVNLHQSIRCDVKSNQFSQVIPSNTGRMSQLLDILRYRSLWYYRGFVDCVINTDNLQVLDRLPKYGRLIHACMHTCIHAYTHTYIHTYIHTYMHACMPTCMPTYMHACIHSYTHACIHTCMYAYIHTYTHTRRQTDRQTDISK